MGNFCVCSAAVAPEVVIQWQDWIMQSKCGHDTSWKVATSLAGTEGSTQQ